MFGLSTREVLSKAILSVSKNKIGIYKQGIIENLNVLSGDSQPEIEEVMTSIRREYLDEVANSVIIAFSVDTPTIGTRIKLVLTSPLICGYDIDIDSGIMAGHLYAICYYAMNNKVASPKDCIKLNHLQNDIITSALIELDNKL